MILQVEDVAYSYPGAARPTFSDVSFTLEAGEVMCLLGTNGAGKTTLLNCIATFNPPLRGRILLHGVEASRLPMRDVARRIGYVPQVRSQTYAFTVREYVTMGRTPHIGLLGTPSDHDYAVAEAALERIDATRLLDKTITEISGGERQLASIARVIAQEPELILLDEPTAHLDYGNQYRMVRLVSDLANEGYAIVMTTHNPDHAFMVDGKVAILNREGTLDVGTTVDVLNGESLSNLYGLPIKTMWDADAQRMITVVS